MWPCCPGAPPRDLSARVRVGAADYLGNQGLERGRLRRRQRAEIAGGGAASGARTSMGDGPAAGTGGAPSGVRSVARGRTQGSRGHVPLPGRAGRGRCRAPGRAARSTGWIPHGELVRFPGRRSLELRPPGAPAKGEAFRSLLDDVRPAVAFMIGDDRTDVAAFRVLRAARDAGELHGRAIAVGPDPMMFDATGHEADVVLKAPRDVAGFLAALARVLSGSASWASSVVVAGAGHSRRVRVLRSRLERRDWLRQHLELGHGPRGPRSSAAPGAATDEGCPGPARSRGRVASPG